VSAERTRAAAALEAAARHAAEACTSVLFVGFLVLFILSRCFAGWAACFLRSQSVAVRSPMHAPPSQLRLSLPCSSLSVPFPTINNKPRHFSSSTFLYVTGYSDNFGVHAAVQNPRAFYARGHMIE